MQNLPYNALAEPTPSPSPSLLARKGRLHARTALVCINPEKSYGYATKHKFYRWYVNRGKYLRNSRRIIEGKAFCLGLLLMALSVAFAAPQQAAAHHQDDTSGRLRAELSTNRREAIAFDQIFWTLYLENISTEPIIVESLRFDFDERLHHFRVRRLTRGEAAISGQVATAADIRILPGEQVVIEFDGEVRPIIETEGDFRPITQQAIIHYRAENDETRYTMRSERVTVRLSPLPLADWPWWGGVVLLTAVVGGGALLYGLWRGLMP